MMSNGPVTLKPSSEIKISLWGRNSACTSINGVRDFPNVGNVPSGIVNINRIAFEHFSDELKMMDTSMAWTADMVIDTVGRFHKNSAHITNLSVTHLKRIDELVSLVEHWDRYIM